MGGKGTDIFGAIDQFSGEIEEASNATLLRLYIGITLFTITIISITIKLIMLIEGRFI
jgi:hypothetical protein